MKILIIYDVIVDIFRTMWTQPKAFLTNVFLLLNE